VGHDLSFEGIHKLSEATKAPGNSFVRIDLVNEVVTIIQPPKNQSMLGYLGLLNTQPSIPEGVEVEYPSYNGITPYSADTRTQMDGNTYPACAVAYLEGDKPGHNDVGLGSAAFIGDYGLLTAAHVIYDSNNGRVYTDITVYPGGLDSRFGSAKAEVIWIPTEYINLRLWDYDYAIIKVSRFFGVGCFGTSIRSDSELQDKSVWVYGFPYDKSFGSPWVSNGIIKEVALRQFGVDTHVTFGNSGGPVVFQNGDGLIVGVMSQDVGVGNFFNYPAAKRVTQDVVEEDLRWT
jgi:V8-like Glu-specific endopeptidase